MARALRELKITDSSQSDLHAPSVCSLEAIRAALPEGATLVEFFQVDDRIVLALVDRERLEIAPVSVMSRVAEHVRMLEFQFSKFRLGADYLRTFREGLLRSTQAHLHALFNELLAPVWPRIEGRRLVIVPHGILHYVPFHALYTGSQYVIDACVVSYAPSASIYATCQEQADGGGTGSLVLGVADAHAPLIAAEANAVAGALPDAQLFTGTDATEHVLRTRGRDCRILHIASPADARRPRDVERVRDRRECRGRRRRAARDHTWSLLRGREDAAPQPVERARREHRDVHDGSLSARRGRSRARDRSARDDAANSRGIPAPVSLGALCRDGQNRARLIFL
jgi:hypothetical protein